MTQSQILNANFDWLQVGKKEHFPEYKIQTQKTMFDRITKAKRSSFDLSKFTVVGNPSISDDGIASGFSNNNYLTTQYTLDFSLSKKYKIICRAFFDGVVPSGQVSFIDSAKGSSPVWNDYTSYSVYKNTGDAHLSAYIGGKGTSILSVPPINKWYDFIIEYDNGTAVFIIVDVETGVEFSRSANFYPDTEFSKVINIGFSSSFGSSTPYTGSIDLKQFSITVDGIEVFNGNKTGVDQIKKDDFTVVGSPTISAEGVLKNTTTANYITIPKEILNSVGTNSWKIEAKGIFNVDAVNVSRTFFGDNDGHSFIIAGKLNLNKSWFNKLFLDVNGTPTDTYINNWSLGDAISGKEIIYTMEYNSATKTYNATLKAEGVTTPYTISYQSDYYLAQLAYDLKTAYNLGNASDFNINALKFYINNELKYQGCLKIPYTQSKTGEKIVDAVYRDRVEQMYNDYGYTHYYTLGDEPEKYNVIKVGSPTLSGGIASGFSSSNYLQKYLDLTSAKSWEIQIPFKTSNDVTTQQRIFDRQDSTSNFISIRVYNSSIYVGLSLGSTIVWDVNTINILGNVAQNTNYLFKIGYDGSSYYVKYTLNGEDIELKRTTSNLIMTTSRLHTIGLGYNYSNPFLGTIDLSQFSIEVDGIEVFRGYEPAILDAYTLQTVPNEKIVDSYYADNSFMELTADLSLTQAGGAVSGQTVNLKRPYKDNKYISTIGTTSKATNSFVASASGQWITKGKGVLG